jgi:hypothetical protein
MPTKYAISASQIPQFTVLKCNLVFVFRCFLHYHFHATCFGNSLPSSGVVPLTISLQLLLESM